MDVEVAASAQLSKKREQRRRGGCKRRGKGANFIPTAVNRGVAFLFGHSPVPVPFDQFLLSNRRGRRRPLLFSLFPSPFPPPRPPRRPARPSPVSPGPPCWGEGEGRRENPRGQKLGTRTCWAKRQKVARSWEKKVFGGGVFCAGQDAGLRRGLPSPSHDLGRRPRAGDGRGLPPPRAPAGRHQSHLWMTLSQPVALPWRRRNAGCGLRAHTPAAEGHRLSAGKTHSPAAGRGGGRV